jgi:hypothetical protein
VDHLDEDQLDEDFRSPEVQVRALNLDEPMAQETPKNKILSFASPDPINVRNTRTSKAASTNESPSSRNWRAEVQQNSRKASAFIETGDKRSIKSPAIDNFEASEFMTIKPTKLDLTGDGIDRTPETDLVILELSTFQENLVESAEKDT